MTEKRRIENQLVQSQRLETLGMLAGGIAHDLNNMLAPILLTADVLIERAASAQDRAMLETLGVT
jgi:C4-dicarboxylate-specific signal transduction histidine kinase